MKQWRKMLDLCDDYFLLADAGPQPEKQVNRYEKIFSKAFYHCGLASYQLGNVRGAKQFFDRTIDQKNEFEGWKTLAYLRRGEIFDLEGKRTEALVKYRAVLKYRDVYDSHKTARARIRKPYSTDSKAGILSGQSPLEPPH
ncbi:MAG: hypothetical protein A2901_07725 [Elusimicrobia bacterium RIFCSPLOWO2_01_FULL_54_10]|nr:MAG: hypothetical protein A2901_07725 [Elusimicrobia bacterium RIFCSPLOWO2_01_FULL_54_10]